MLYRATWISFRSYVKSSFSCAFDKLNACKSICIKYFLIAIDIYTSIIYFCRLFFWLESLALEENPREQLLINLSKISIFKIFKIAVFHFQVVPFFKITSQLIFPRLSHLVAFAELHEYDRYGNDGVSDTLVVQKRNDFLCDMIENVHTLQAAI